MFRSKREFAAIFPPWERGGFAVKLSGYPALVGGLPGPAPEGRISS